VFTSLSAEDLGLTVSFDEAVGIAAAAGFEAVDIHMAELLGKSEEPSASTIQDQLDAAGLRSGGWWLPVEFREGQDQFEAELAQLPRAGRLARALGSPWCLTWVWPFSDELDHKSNWALHANRLGRVAGELAEYGCRLGFEFIGSRTMRAGHKYDFISTLPQALELIDDIKADNVGLLLDCFQWYVSGGDAASLDALAEDQVVYVHLNDAPADRPIADQVDNQRRLPGATGVIDIDTFLRTLKRLNFEGPIAVEPYDPAISDLPPVERATAARASVDSVFKKVGVSMD
jgi:sugar phosphate isomerase/epimerase